MVRIINQALGRRAGSLLLLAVIIWVVASAHAQEAVPAQDVAATSATATQPAPATDSATTTVTQTIEAPSEAPAAPATAALIPLTTGTATTSREIEITTATAITAPGLETTTDTVIQSAVPAVPLPIGAAPTSDTTAVEAPGTLEPPAITSVVTTETTTVETPAAELIAPVAPPPAVTAGAQAPYLREYLPLEIFDKGKGEEMTPLQQAAKILAESRERQQRRSLANIQNLVTYDYDLEGKAAAELREEAMVRALKSAAGRLYFENYMLLGLDLLEPYLRKNGRPFVARSTVLEEHVVAGGRVAMRIRVSVNLDSLYRDLHEKHFITQPNLRPTVAVFLQEIINGQPDASAGGRGRIERTMEQNLIQAFSSQVKSPPLGTDLSNAPSQLRQARMQAQRAGADVIITGTLSVRPVNDKQIFYDPYSFQEADVVLRMYRVDTGELIGEARDRYSASAPTTEDSIKKVLDLMLARVSQRMADELAGLWNNTILVQGVYRLMFNGVDEKKVATIRNLLEGIAPDTQVFEKSYYGDVLVLNVKAPQQSATQLGTFLKTSTEPQFSIRQVDKRRFIVNVL